MMHLLADQLTQQLMPLYIRDVNRFFLEPNFEQSTVLSELYAEMRQSQMKAAVYGYKNGMLGFTEAREMAGLPAEIEVYAGALHGWCPPDSRVYNEAQAERAWSRLLALFETALA